MTKKSDRAGFMKAFLTSSQPIDGSDLRRFGGTEIKISDRAEFRDLLEDEVYLDSIKSAEQERGHGTSTLKAITKLADEYGVWVWAHAVSPVNEEGAPSMADLRNFYGKHGFEKGGPKGQGVLVREPAAPQNV